MSLNTQKRHSPVALRKESVDRNTNFSGGAGQLIKSLSARRAWIEILGWYFVAYSRRRSPQGERG